MILENLAISIMEICKKCVIITHNDLDGYSAGSILYHIAKDIGYPEEDITILNRDYVDPFELDAENTLVFISDISVSTKENANKLLKLNKNNIVIWFDHHDSSIKLVKDIPELATIYGMRDTNACGAMLCAIFYQSLISPYTCDKLLDTLENMKAIDISEITNKNTLKILEKPKQDINAHGIYLLKIIDDFDRFILKYPESLYMNESFLYNLNIQKDCKGTYWEKYLFNPNKSSSYILNTNIELFNLLKFGENCFLYGKIKDHCVLRDKGFIANFDHSDIENIDILCVNSSTKGAMIFGDSIDSSKDGSIKYGCVFSYDGNKFSASVYHRGNSKPFSAAEICQKFGGGGHPGAAGFVKKNIPFKNIRPIPEKTLAILNESIRIIEDKLSMPKGDYTKWYINKIFDELQIVK